MKAPEFDLMGVDGKRYSPVTVRGDHGLLVMFICNHCPYVKKALDQILRDCRELAKHGIGSIAVMSNDPSDYPEDSFDNMQRIATEKAFPFPYVFDETARTHGLDPTLDLPRDKLQFIQELSVTSGAQPRLVDLAQAVDAGPRQKALKLVGQ